MNNGPIEPKDLLGRDLNEGDYIAYALGGRGSRSVHMTVGQIDKINFKRPNPDPNHRYRDRLISCPQHLATKYTVRVKPLKSTGRYWSGYAGQVRPVTLQKVTNIVKVDADYIADDISKRDDKDA